MPLVDSFFSVVDSRNCQEVWERYDGERSDDAVFSDGDFGLFSVHFCGDNDDTCGRVGVGEDEY